MREEERIGQRQSKHVEKRNAHFKELLSYRSEHGDCNVPKKHGKLGIWVNSQRSAHVAGSLARDHMDRLYSIGFKWALSAQSPWETRFNELVMVFFSCANRAI